jgi:hypothetical protein
LKIICTKTLIRIYSFLFLTSYFSLIYAQAPDTLWTKTYGGDSTDVGFSVKETFDGGYIIAGYTLSFGVNHADIYLIKTDINGDTLWTKIYNIPNRWDMARDVQQTSDSGYVVTGVSSTGEDAFFLMKTNAFGDTVWTKTYGGASHDQAWSVQQTLDKGYIVAGRTMSFGAGGYDYYLIKTDSLGDTLWTKTYGGLEHDYAYSVQQTTDSGYIVVGYTWSYGAGVNDVYLIKTDSSGDTLWTKVYGGASVDIGYSVQQTIDGGYIIVGVTASYGNGMIYCLKTDQNGDTLWTRLLGGSTYQTTGRSVDQTMDSGYIITGHTQLSGQESDVYCVKINAAGDTIWSRIYGGVERERSFSVQQTSDGGYIITGRTYSFGAGESDVWLLKLASDPGVVENKSQYIPLPLQVVPNPFSKLTSINFTVEQNIKNVELALYSSAGRMVRAIDHVVSPGLNKLQWVGDDGSGHMLPNGVYFLKLKIRDSVVVKKVLIIR